MVRRYAVTHTDRIIFLKLNGRCLVLCFYFSVSKVTCSQLRDAGRQFPQPRLADRSTIPSTNLWVTVATRKEQTGTLQPIAFPENRYNPVFF
jgi:hypothetical protein